MMKGDAYKLPIQIKFKNGIAKDEDFSDVEIIWGNIRKTKSKGEVTFADGYFLFPLTQEETFALTSYGVGHTEIEMQIRVKTPTNDVYGTSLGKINVLDTLNKAEVL